MLLITELVVSGIQCRIISVFKTTQSGNVFKTVLTVYFPLLSSIKWTEFFVQDLDLKNQLSLHLRRKIDPVTGGRSS